MTAKTRAKPSLHRDNFLAPLALGTRTLPGAVVGLRLLKHTAGPLACTLTIWMIEIRMSYEENLIRNCFDESLKYIRPLLQNYRLYRIERNF